jgi:5-methylcytosine-specific restriction endonuclease McrA
MLRVTRKPPPPPSSPHRTGGDGDKTTFGYNAARLSSPSPSEALYSFSEPPQRRVKRSVSETKKKYVAARQNWTCAECGTMLTAWFEVDHVKRLEHGGSNDATNLVALCRECHGKKTALENM